MITTLLALACLHLALLLVLMDRRVTSLERKARNAANDAWYEGYLYAVDAASKSHPRDADGKFVSK